MKEDGRYPHNNIVAKITEDIDWSKATETVEYNGKTYKAHLASGIYDTISITSVLDPNLSLTDAGDLVIEGDKNNFQVKNTADNSIIDRIGAFGKLVSANITAGSITAKEAFIEGGFEVADTIIAGAVETKDVTTDSFLAFQGTVDNLLVKSGLVSPLVKTALISPLDDESDVTVQIGKENTDGTSSFGKLIVEDATGSAVAQIDTSGNATFSGTLEADSVETNEIAVSKLYADEIIARSGQFADLKFATGSGVTLEQIEALLKEAQADQALLADSSDWNTNTATSSADISELAISSLYVTDQAAINNLSVTNSVVVGNDFTIQTVTNEAGLASTSINTLSSPLKIQSLALAPVEIMAGMVKIDTNGDVTISGNLYIAGRIESSGLDIKAKEEPADSGFKNLLSISDIDGNKIASVDASGSARFASLETDKLVIAGSEIATASAVVNGELATNATAGIAVVPADTAEITIRNPHVGSYTLVYVTPTSSTLNNVLYVKSKGEGYFVVGFNNPVDRDVTFNWWVVEVTAANN